MIYNICYNSIWHNYLVAAPGTMPENPRKLKRGNATWVQFLKKAERRLGQLARIRLSLDDGKHSLPEYILSLDEPERMAFFDVIQKILEMTERQKRRYAHFAAMFNTYHKNSEWKTSTGVVEIHIKYYDYSCVPWIHRIQPEKKRICKWNMLCKGYCRSWNNYVGFWQDRVRWHCAWYYFRAVATSIHYLCVYERPQQFNNYLYFLSYINIIMFLLYGKYYN